MAYSLGIDLGTTYSAAATAHDDRVEIFQLGERAATIPSIVVLRADGEVLTGDAAERRSLAEPTRTAREFKRRLGDPTPIILGGTPYGAEALLAHLLRAIVARVTTQSGAAPDAIVVTHPASYGAYKIDLLEQAIRQADLANVTLLTEPEAAAVFYAQQERVPAGAVIAVYDFGGGTFDATMLRKTETGFEQLGRPEGMERLGGIDFDEALFTKVMAMVRASGAVVNPDDPATLAAIARLREECRRAKEALSSDTDTTISVVLPGLQTEMRLTREEFEEMIRPRITETIGALGRAVKSAGLEFDGVDRILLVGGSSRIPLVAEMVREATGRPIAVDAHPKHSMALGAALVAEARRRAAGDEAAAVAGAGAIAAATGLAAAAGVASGTEPGAAEPAAGARRRGGRRCRGRATGRRCGAGSGRSVRSGWRPTTGRSDDDRAPSCGRELVRRDSPATGRDGLRTTGRVRVEQPDDDRDRRRAGRDPRRRGGRRGIRDALGWRGVAESGRVGGGRLDRAVGRAIGRSIRGPVGRAERRTDRRPDGHPGADAEPDTGRAPGPDQRDHAQREHVRRPVAGLRLQTGPARPARPLLLRHGQAGRCRDPRRRPLVRLRRTEPVQGLQGQ